MWGTWLAGVGKEVSFETVFERANGLPSIGSFKHSLIFCGIEFQIVGAANLKALRPTPLAVKGTCVYGPQQERSNPPRNIPGY